MFVQSHIQRNRHPAGTTTSATAATSAPAHQRQVAVHHHRHHHQHHRNAPQQHQHQRANVEAHRAWKSQEPSKREQSERLTSSRGVGRTSDQGGQHSSFLGQINQHDVIRALEELDSSGQLIERIANAPDDGQLLEQVELVESKLVARQVAKRAAGNKKDPVAGQKIRVECRQRPFVKSISLLNLISSRHQEEEKSEEANLRGRSRTINSFLEEPPHVLDSSKLDSNEKWTQVNGSLDDIHSHHQRELRSESVWRQSGGLVRGVLDLPRTLWNLWLTRAGGAANDDEGSSVGPLNLRKNLRVVAWFWVNFIAFQCETLRQIYLTARSSRLESVQARRGMAASRSEFSATTMHPNGLHHRYAHNQAHFYSPRSRNNNYANPSIALVGSIDPRLAQYRAEAYSRGQHYRETRARHYDQHPHTHQPNHVHVHNHDGLANYHCNHHFEQTILECTCAPQLAASNGPASMLRPEQAAPSSHAFNVQTYDGLTRQNVIGTQQQAAANPAEPSWQWHLRHTVDGSPITSRRAQPPTRAPHYHAAYEQGDDVSSIAHRTLYPEGTHPERNRASASSPTLPELEPAIEPTARAGALPVGLVDWRLGYSSDELSVISDHEPLEQSSPALSGAPERMRASSQLNPSQRRAQALPSWRAQNTGWWSMDREQSANCCPRTQARIRDATSSSKRASTNNRLVAQASLTTRHTSSASGISLSSATSLHNQTSGRSENAQDGASSGAESADQQPQLQSGSRRRASPLSRVSLAGAKRRLGFRRRGGGLNSLSVHRSEEVFPYEIIAAPLAASHLSSGERRRQYANTTGSSSLNDSSFDSAAPAAGLARAAWLNQFRGSPDPKVCFVEGLGAGQIASRQALVSPYLGDIQLGLSDRRGMLEVEVIRVRQLQMKPAATRLPSPYVKAYLMRDKKCLAKFKTTQVRETLDPLYQQQFIFRDDYSNCVLQLIVWGDYGKKDKKSLMGAVQIYINDLDMSSLVIGWYKLFNAPSMMSSSLASSSKALRQTMSSSRLAADFCPLPS